MVSEHPADGQELPRAVRVSQSTYFKYPKLLDKLVICSAYTPVHTVHIYTGHMFRVEINLDVIYIFNVQKNA